MAVLLSLRQRESDKGYSQAVVNPAQSPDDWRWTGQEGALFMPEVRTEFHWRVMKAFDDAIDAMNYEMVIYPLFSGRRLERLHNDTTLLRDSDGAVSVR